MEIIIISSAIIAFMPLLAKIPVAIEMNKLGGYNNRMPRAQQAKLSNFGARAMAAQNNCFEAISYYALTILMVVGFDAQNSVTGYLCMAFVVLRLFYLVCYWVDAHVLRSIFWVSGMLTLLAHYWLLLF